MKRLLALCAVAVVSSCVSTAHAAAPRIVIVSGKPLAHQVVISDWGRISTIVEEVSTSRAASRTELAHRPRLKFSMFWGPQWDYYLRSGQAATALRPRQADQFGGFYPAWRGRAAMIDLPWAGRWPRAMSAKALSVLERYGVPIRLASTRS